MMRGTSKLLLTGVAVTGAAAFIASCASILGIEDLQPGSDGGAGSAGASTGSSGAGGSAGSGGQTIGSGGTAGSSSSGAGGASGGTAGASSTGSSGASGSSGAAGSSTGGSGGTAPDGGTGGSAGGLVDGGRSDASSDARDGQAEVGPTTITVSGTVIGYWKHRVPNVDVYLGARTTKTDINGQFTFANVTPPYDIGLAVRGYRDAGWLFKGLTRTDPTLQVKDAFDTKSAPSTYNYPNRPPQSTGDAGLIPRNLRIAFGSPDTTFELDAFDQRFDSYDYAYGSWEGGADGTVGTAHGLLFDTTPDRELPIRYVAYDAKPLSLTFNTRATVGLDLSADVIAADQVAGSITSFASDRRVNAYVRFDSGAIMSILSIDSSPANFSVLMPKLQGATISVSAFTGTTNTGPFGLAHRDGLIPGDPGIQLTVPQPVSLSLPAAGATGVTTSTMFQWSASPRVAMLSVACDGPASNIPGMSFYVVTEDYRATLPALAGAMGLPLPKNTHCYWWVEVHGSYATVNDAAGRDGMLDPFSYDYAGTFSGPKRDNGSFTTSQEWGLTIAP